MISKKIKVDNNSIKKITVKKVLEKNKIIIQKKKLIFTIR